MAAACEGDPGFEPRPRPIPEFSEPATRAPARAPEPAEAAPAPVKATAEQLRELTLAGDPRALDALLRAAYLQGAREYSIEARRRGDATQRRKGQRKRARASRKANR
jgi:hypothetical protein